MIQPRTELSQVSPVPHGSTHRDDISDFSSSVIPIDIPIDEILKGTNIFRYPDTESAQLRSVLASLLGVERDMIVAGNGASELFFMIGLSYLRPGVRFGQLRPTFGEYARVAHVMGAEVLEFILNESQSFQLESEALAHWIHQENIDCFALCNPNNPTGRFVPFDDLIHLLDSCPDCLFLIDLAYVDYVNQRVPTQKLSDRHNVILVFSLTKAFGIAGLRSGYAVASPAIIRILNKVRPPWNVNVLAQNVSTWLIQNRTRFLPVIARYREEAENLSSQLVQAGYHCIPSDTDFFMLRVPDSLQAKATLLRRGFLVRELASLGCPRYIRINVCDGPTNQRFAEACLRAL